MKRIAFFLATFLFLATISVIQGQEVKDVKTKSSANESSKMSTKYVILPGIGVQECSLGMDESDFQRVFGGKRHGDYFISKDNGVDASIKLGKINVLFFYFYSKTYQSFRGATDKGIGCNSSIEDVLTKYGEPEDIGESVVSEYGAMPGAHEKDLSYYSLGIHFTFWDGRLADIRITYPKK